MNGNDNQRLLAADIWDGSPDELSEVLEKISKRIIRKTSVLPIEFVREYLLAAAEVLREK